MQIDIASAQKSVLKILAGINRAWRQAKPQDMEPFLHSDIVMVYPGFNGRTAGKKAFIKGFEEFCENGTVESYRESEHMVDISGGTAVASYKFDMVYRLKNGACHSSGRDFWIFENQGETWLAVWRTMFDLREKPAEVGS